MNCTVRGTKTFYEAIGRGRPIVNLHGWPGEHGQMLQMMEPLFERRHAWRRIYVDLPGMGNTAGPDWLTTHDQMLDFVAEFIARVAEERPLLVGHSYGAQLVQGLLQRDPDGYSAALLLSPGRTGAAEECAPFVLAEDPGFLAAIEEERPFLDLFVVRTLPVLEMVRRQSLLGVSQADYPFLALIEQGLGFSYLQESPKPFGGPVLICSGRQDPAGGQVTEGFMDRYPRGSLAILDRAGHLLFAEQPDLFLHLAGDWLDRAAEEAGRSGG